MLYVLGFDETPKLLFLMKYNVTILQFYHTSLSVNENRIKQL